MDTENGTLNTEIGTLDTENGTSNTKMELKMAGEKCYLSQNRRFTRIGSCSGIKNNLFREKHTSKMNYLPVKFGGRLLKKGGHAFPEIRRPARFELALVLEIELLRQVI